MSDNTTLAIQVSRRAFLSSMTIAGVAALAGALGSRRVVAQGTAPAIITADNTRPAIPCGVASGDITADAAIVWSRTDRPARLIVEYATTEAFHDVRRVIGPAALVDSDFTARIDLTSLPRGQDIFYRVLFQDLSDLKTMSAPATGRFRTPPAGPRTI